MEVASESISNCGQIISATTSGTDKLKINFIHYELAANDDYYVANGDGLKESLEVPQGMLGANWDIKYFGLTQPGNSEIRFKPHGDNEYDLLFTNNRGQAYDFPLLSDTDATFLWGDENYRLLFTEPGDTADPFTGDYMFIAKRDYFLVSDKTVNTNEKAVTSVMRYKGISTSTSTITVEEVGVGETKWNYVGTPGTDATGTMTIAGADHTFWVGDDGDDIAVDLDGSGTLNASAVINIAFRGEGYIAMPEQVFTDNKTLDEAYVGGENFTLTTPENKFISDKSGYEQTNITVYGTAGATEGVSLTVSGAGDTTSDPNKDDYEYGLSTYGAYFELYSPSGSNEADDLTIEYPLSQRGGQVFVTAGVVEVSEGTETEGGEIISTILNPIGVGLAVLDTDAEALFGTTKLIAVGGPCVNTIAARLMGNPADCTQGFTPGKAIIKLFTAQNALLVAGYSAQDTLGASYVLGDYEDYNLAGTEVEVVVADLNSITVNQVS